MQARVLLAPLELQTPKSKHVVPDRQYFDNLLLAFDGLLVFLVMIIFLSGFGSHWHMLAIWFLAKIVFLSVLGSPAWPAIFFISLHLRKNNFDAARI